MRFFGVYYKGDVSIGLIYTRQVAYEMRRVGSVGRVSSLVNSSFLHEECFINMLRFLGLWKLSLNWQHFNETTDNYSYIFVWFWFLLFEFFNIFHTKLQIQKLFHVFYFLFFHVIFKFFMHLLHIPFYFFHLRRVLGLNDGELFLDFCVLVLNILFDNF